jgi:hypothetical protein
VTFAACFAGSLNDSMNSSSYRRLGQRAVTRPLLVLT